jgi:asparagine synthase (glutamine-hydrolysing)
MYDCLRANKSLAAWGIEGRVPFLDKEFMDVAMRINPQDKMINKEHPMEKWVVRKAFEDMLPESVAWRQKEQFSDGVGFNWIDSLKEYANDKVSDRQMRFSNLLFPYNTPLTKEAYLYRSIFYKHYPLDIYAQTVEQEETIACSTANAIKWDASFNNNLDPSGQFLSNSLKKI